MSRRALGSALLFGLIALVGAGCGEREATGVADELSSDPAIRFTDVSAETGIDVLMVSAREKISQIVESTGTGLALLDYDQDGDLDVIIPNGSNLDRPRQGVGASLYRNDGGLRFVDVASSVGLDFDGWGMGVAVGDVDADGWPDLYVTGYGPNALYRNVQGRFEDVTMSSGTGDEGWGTGAAFGDVDGDGDLDLYVANYVAYEADEPPERALFKGVRVFRGPQSLTPQRDVLYANNGDGTFTDVTDAWGCGTVAPSYGLGVVMVDFDGDDQLEIFVANDGERNFLFDDDPDAGDGPRRLADRGTMSGVGLAGNGLERASMGIGIADIDGNGYPDIFTTNFSSDPNTLHLNLDGRFFEDRTSQYGLVAVSRPYLGWSTMLYDFDLDGDEDVFVVNGHVYSNATMKTMDSEALQPPLLMRRDEQRFERLSPEEAGPWLGEPHNDRNAAFGDLDGDGDIDIVIGGINQRVRVLRNDSVRAGHWLEVELRDTRPGAPPAGLGARVELESGGRIQRRWIFSGGGYQSVSPPYAHFGIPEDGGRVVLTVRWPDGTEQVLQDIELDQHLVVERR